MAYIKIDYCPQRYAIKSRKNNSVKCDFLNQYVYGNGFEGVISAVLFALDEDKSSIEISEDARNRLGYKTSRTLELIVKHPEIFRPLK